jgi:hypothetical protein
MVGPGEHDPESAPGGSPRAGQWRWAITVIRIALGYVVLDVLSGRHLLFQAVVVPLGVASVIWWERWVGVVLLAIAVVVFLAYRLVSWIIERLSMPRRVRKMLDGAKDEIRSELRELELPTGVLSGLRFLGRLIRGRYSDRDLGWRLQAAVDRIGPIVSRALADAGTPNWRGGFSP